MNTVSGRPQYSRDDLAVPVDLLDWSDAARRVHDRLPVLTDAPTRRQLQEAKGLREGLYEMLVPVTGGHRPAVRSERWLLDRASAATRAASLTRTPDGFAMEWNGEDVAALDHALAAAALQLLCSADVDRVKACDGCGWLFLDTSRAGGRRWCSMSMCGARHKMRRYHQRQKGKVAS